MTNHDTRTCTTTNHNMRPIGLSRLYCLRCNVINCRFILLILPTTTVDSYSCLNFKIDFILVDTIVWCSSRGAASVLLSFSSLALPSSLCYPHILLLFSIHNRTTFTCTFLDVSPTYVVPLIFSFRILSDL